MPNLIWYPGQVPDIAELSEQDYGIKGFAGLVFFSLFSKGRCQLADRGFSLFYQYSTPKGVVGF